MTDATDGSRRPPLLGNWLPVLEDRLECGDRLTLCLDFDGTLAPIVEDPDSASIPDRTSQTLASLADRPDVDLAVVSGRSLTDLRERVDIAECTLAGNHGLEIEIDSGGGDPDGDRRWIHPGVNERRDTIGRASAAVERRIESIPGCRLENKGLTATVHYRGADATHETVRRLVDGVLADFEGIEATDGREIVEMRPAVDWDKGDAVRRLADGRSVVIYAGDDETDEDAFRALEDLSCGGVGILVGDRPSAAELRVHDTDGVRAFLEWLERKSLVGQSASRSDPARSSS